MSPRPSPVTPTDSPEARDAGVRTAEPPSPRRWWQARWVLWGWGVCMLLAVLWEAVPLDLPHPAGYLLHGVGFAPWLPLAVRYIRRGVREGSAVHLLGLLAGVRRRRVSRARHPVLFWANVAGAGGAGVWTGATGAWVLWLGLLDLGTLVRLALT